MLLLTSQKGTLFVLDIVSGQTHKLGNWFAKWGIHPMADLGQLTQSSLMTMISRYPLGPSQQALLEALVGSPQPILTDKTSIARKSGSSEEPSELNADFEDPPNGGIGE